MPTNPGGATGTPELPILVKVYPVRLHLQERTTGIYLTVFLHISQLYHNTTYLSTLDNNILRYFSITSSSPCMIRILPNNTLIISSLSIPLLYHNLSRCTFLLFSPRRRTALNHDTPRTPCPCIPMQIHRYPPNPPCILNIFHSATRSGLCPLGDWTLVTLKSFMVKYRSLFLAFLAMRFCILTQSNPSLLWHICSSGYHIEFFIDCSSRGQIGALHASNWQSIIHPHHFIYAI